MLYHVPVLLKESVDALNINPNGIYVDVTFGGGGHSREILSRLGEKGKLIAFDKDKDAINNLPQDDRIIFVRNNFRFIGTYLLYHNIEKVDGILADLGVSSHHFDDGKRGFSFRFPEAELDMRMNTNSILTATKILNGYSVNDISGILKEYGEIKGAYRLANAIEARRTLTPFNLVQDFVDFLEPFAPRNELNKFLAQVFQALRIEVNKEMVVLDHFLSQTPDLLKQGGRLSVISYHSLEDRLVKNIVKTGNTKGKVEKDFYGNWSSPFAAINKKIIIPTDDEIAANSRARSAKLRIAEKL